MNAVEIEEAVSKLAAKPFDRAEFPYAFLAAFGNKPTTIARLRSGASNSSDIFGGVLQRSNIHIATCDAGQTAGVLEALKLSPKTAAAKARFVVATDGVTFEAEDLASDDAPVICEYADFPNHFGFFLPLAGISTVRQIRESAFDVRATGRLSKLYVELRNENPDWDTSARQHDMNHFMARLIFCFFAEDTDIFSREGIFTETLEQMSAPDGSNLHEVIEQIFRAMNTKWDDRKAAGFRPWAETFPYVNGGLFSGSTAVPRFTKLARAFLLNIGRLEWRKINPDIFGSMIQAVADDEERGALGMHYTSVPNILKVLNPLFLDDLRAKLEEAGQNSRMLLNLRKRMSRIRIFDPACGSGNFLVIAYKQLREIEAEINRIRGETDRKTDIPVTNFRGIEIRDFAAEIARLALIIAEYQCDVLYRGQKEALKEFLPLDSENWITCGNALRLDWLSVCPPTGTGVRYQTDDLFSTPRDQAQIDFQNEGGETYVCGNPPYIGDKMQLPAHKADLEPILSPAFASWRSLDYVFGFIKKGIEMVAKTSARMAFVTTKSIVQGQQVGIFWPSQFAHAEFFFAHRPFKWSNLAPQNAGVTCVIIGICEKGDARDRIIFDGDSKKIVRNISPYLTDGPSLFINKSNAPISDLPRMSLGNVLKDDGNLQLEESECEELNGSERQRFVRKIVGSTEFIRGTYRRCLYLKDSDAKRGNLSTTIEEKLRQTSSYRIASRAPALRDLASSPNRYYFHLPAGVKHTIVVPRVTSENRDYLPVGFLSSKVLISDRNYGLVDAPSWVISLVASRLHWIWIGTVCVRLEMRFSYSNTLGWNTFPMPTLTEQNKADLTRSAERILLAREAHFPATIADLYDPETMPDNLREAHERNDEVVERIYIGRRFRNDTERLEKLFELYTKIIASAPKVKSARKKAKGA